MSDRIQVRWVESAGGPLVLVPSSQLRSWQGGAGPPGASDYDRACAVADYAGVLAGDGCEILVLGDEPLRTAFVADGPHPALIRWLYSPSEQALFAAVRDADLDHLEPVEEVELDVREPAHLLFDAAAAGGEEQGLEVRLVPGRRRVRSYLLEPSREVGALVHFFV